MVLIAAASVVSGFLVVTVATSLIQRARQRVYDAQMRMAWQLGDDAGRALYWIRPEEAPKGCRFCTEFEPWARPTTRRIQTHFSALINFAEGQRAGWMSEAVADTVDQARSVLMGRESA